MIGRIWNDRVIMQAYPSNKLNKNQAKQKHKPQQQRTNRFCKSEFDYTITDSVT